MIFSEKGKKSFLTVPALTVKFMAKYLRSYMAGQVVQKVSKIQGPQRAWDGKSEMNMTVEKWYPENATSQTNFCHFLSKWIWIDTGTLLAMKL